MIKFKNIAILAMLCGSAVTWSENPTFTAQQTKAIEQIIADYLVHNPEILVQASQALQEKQQKEMQSQANAFIKQNAKQLLAEKISVVGSKAPTVTIVEFFDYACGHCIKMNPVITELVKTNPDLQVVYREFPIFGEKSANASKAALAAGLQGKYAEMHEILFNTKNIDNAAITAAAKKLNLDMARFAKDMNSQEVAENLAVNRQLAEKMKLFGTPVFIVMSTPNGQFNAASNPVMIPGSTSLDNLQNVVKMVSEAK